MKNIDEQFIKSVEILEKQGKIKSRTQLATNLGYKQAAFTEILKGRSKVNAYILQNFCKIYNINLYWLFYGEGDMFNNESKKPPLPDIDIEELESMKEKIETLLRNKQGFIS